MARPHCCPVCYGRRGVPIGFYNANPNGSSSTTTTVNEPCRSCGGSGVVWEQEASTDDNLPSGWVYVAEGTEVEG